MKKLVYLSSCLLLLSAVFAASSCDSDDPSEQPNSHQNETPVDSTIVNNDTTMIDSTEAYIIISAVPVSDEVKIFFDEALPIEEGGVADFLFNNHVTGSYSYYVINDELELREQYKNHK